MIPLAILLTGELSEMIDWSTADEAFVRFETSSSYMFCRPTVGAKYWHFIIHSKYFSVSV